MTVLLKLDIYREFWDS